MAVQSGDSCAADALEHSVELAAASIAPELRPASPLSTTILSECAL